MVFKRGDMGGDLSFLRWGNKKGGAFWCSKEASLRCLRWPGLVPVVFFFAVFAAVDFVFFVGEDEDVV